MIDANGFDWEAFAACSTSQKGPEPDYVDDFEAWSKWFLGEAPQQEDHLADAVSYGMSAMKLSVVEDSWDWSRGVELLPYQRMGIDLAVSKKPLRIETSERPRSSRGPIQWRQDGGKWKNVVKVPSRRRLVVLADRRFREAKKRSS